MTLRVKVKRYRLWRRSSQTRPPPPPVISSCCSRKRHATASEFYSEPNRWIRAVLPLITISVKAYYCIGVGCHSAQCWRWQCGAPWSQSGTEPEVKASKQTNNTEPCPPSSQPFFWDVISDFCAPTPSPYYHTHVPLGTRCYGEVESTSMTLIKHRNNVVCSVG